MTGMKLPRFQFRVRTLLIGVTLLAMACAYVGWQAKIVSERIALRERIEKMGVEFTIAAGPTSLWINLERNPMPWPRNWLGDKRVGGIAIPAALTKEDIALIRRLFPEAYLYQAGDIRKSL